MFSKKTSRMTASIVFACLLLVVSACGGSGKSGDDSPNGSAASQSDNPSSQAASSKDASPSEKVEINFYGKNPEWSSIPPMFEKTQELLKDKYVINPIQVDFSNLQKVIKTGIASGTPADIYHYWPNQMKPFIDIGQALDLTPYLEANGGEWMKTFDPELLKTGLYDGKYYALPVSSNFSVLYINKTLYEQAGLTVPAEWTWEQFMEANKTIKEKTGRMPFAIHRVLQDWIYRNGVLSLAKQANKLEDVAAGRVPGTDPIFATPLQRMKELYDGKYWYPGNGALTSTKEEAMAAFMQGKVVMLAEVASDAAKIIEDGKNNNIDVVAVFWPSMGDETVILGGADGYFIPANVANKEAAVEVLKTFLSKEVAQIHADAGYASANGEVQVTNPSIQNLIKMGGKVYPNEIISLSPKIFDYIIKEMIPNYILGSKSEQETLEKLESLRKEAVKE